MPQKKISSRTLIILIILWIAFIAFITFLAMATGQGRWDFITYHHNAERLVQGEALYQGYTARYDYIYPPLLAQVIAPLTRFLSLDVISLGWHILSIILLILSIWLVNHYVKNPNQRLVFWLMPILFIPNMQSFWVGQISVVMLACLVGAWVAYKEDRPVIAGILLALITWLKIYPVFVLVYFLWKREWKLIFSAFITGILLGVLQIAISGLPTLMQYFTEILPRLATNGQNIGLFKNSSLLGFAHKLFTETSAIIPLVDSPTLASITRWFLVILVIGGSVWLITRPQKHQESPKHSARFDLEYALVVLVSLLFASTLWLSGMTPLMLCYQILLIQPLTRGYRNLTRLSFFLVAIYFPFLLAYQPNNKLPALVLSIGFYGVFLLWILMVLQLRKTINTDRSLP